MVLTVDFSFSLQLLIIKFSFRTNQVNARRRGQARRAHSGTSWAEIIKQLRAGVEEEIKGADIAHCRRERFLEPALQA